MTQTIIPATIKVTKSNNALYITGRTIQFAICNDVDEFGDRRQLERRKGEPSEWSWTFGTDEELIAECSEIIHDYEDEVCED
jgi:hypothetical protein